LGLNGSDRATIWNFHPGSHNEYMSQSFIRDKSGKVVLWQSPNPVIIGWAIFALASRLTHSQLLAWVGTALLLTWALMEIFQGVSYFRRTLGLVVLALTVGSLFR